MITEKIENIEELIEEDADGERITEIVNEIREEVDELYEEDQISQDTKTEITELLDNLQTEYTHTYESTVIEPILGELKDIVAEIE